MNPAILQMLFRIMNMGRRGIGPFTNGFQGQGPSTAPRTPWQGGQPWNPPRMGTPPPQGQMPMSAPPSFAGYGGGQMQAPRSAPPPFGGGMPANAQGSPMAMENSNSPWARGMTPGGGMTTAEGPGQGRGYSMRVRVQ
jgi:hypothetical protein